MYKYVCVFNFVYFVKQKYKQNKQKKLNDFVLFFFVGIFLSLTNKLFFSVVLFNKTHSYIDQQIYHSYTYTHTHIFPK